LLKIFFAGQHKDGSIDLEAVEGATRAAVHRAGAALLARLLNEHGCNTTAILCGCGHEAPFHAIRSRQLLTAVGPVVFERAYYYCSHCHQGQVPQDRELDIVGTEYSPGVRRMMAAVGSDASFDQGREQLELLAGLHVTRKAVERHAEAIGDDIERRDQARIQRAVQLDLPDVTGNNIPVLYIEMDGTGVPVTAKEAEVRIPRDGDQRSEVMSITIPK